MRRSTLTSAVVTALAVAAIAPAGASAATRTHHASAKAGEEAFAQITGQPRGRVHVAVKINRFVATASGPQAKGTATATLRSLGAAPTTVKKKVTLAVAKKGSCNILTLTLQQLDLTLLGLNVHLDKVNLQVTGQKKGGILGRLFCSLAGAKVKTAAATAAAHRLTVRATRHPMQLMSLSTGVRAKTAQASTCSVLDLVLGPLHLNLLGLVIDLNRVHLTITATRGGGILGDLFCGLASTPAPTG